MEKSKIPFRQPQIKTTFPIYFEPKPPARSNKYLTRVTKSSIDSSKFKLAPRPAAPSIKHGRIEKIQTVSKPINSGVIPERTYNRTLCETLQTKHAELEAKFNQISEKYMAVTRQIEELQNVHHLLESKMNECNEKDQFINDLKLQLLSAKQEQQNVLESLQDLRQNYDYTAMQLAEVESQLKSMQKDHKNLQNSCEKLKLENIENGIQIKLNQDKIQHLRRYLVATDTSRRKLHNTIQSLKGNIRVFCRVRPTLKVESNRTVADISYLNQYKMEILNGSLKSVTGLSRTTKQEFSFDYIFGPESSQEQIFEELHQVVQSALDGYNVCVFAYGQTGSGKTFTMEGTDHQLGMIPRTLDYIFQVIEDRKALNWTFEVKASFLEIYNEQLQDLLNTNKKLTYEIRMINSKTPDIYVTNLKEQVIRTSAELNALLQRAQKNRAVSATEMNDRSSRSHAVTKIHITSRINDETFTSCLNLVDLAGSERSRSSTRLTETKHINKSLSCLGNVILSLHQQKDHIPYRDSKLTHLLMTSLGGNSKTLMIVNIAPFSDCLNESLNSLRFASKVKECKVGSLKKNRIEESQLQ